MKWSVNAENRYTELLTLNGTQGKLLRRLIEREARKYITAEVRPVHVAMGWRRYRATPIQRAFTEVEAA